MTDGPQPLMPLARLTIAQRDEFWSEGFIRVPEALSEAECDQIVEAMWRRQEALGTPPGKNASEFAVWRFDPCFLDVMDNRRVLGLAIDLMGEDIQVMSTQYMIRWPGREDANWHVDGPALADLGWGYPPALPPQSLTQIKAAYALHDLTEPDSGVTLVSPGSHWLPNSGVDEYVKTGTEPANAIARTMKKGDAFLFHQSVWHSPGSIGRDQPRLMLFYAYNYVWAYPFDWEPVSEEVFNALNPTQRRLLLPFHDVDGPLPETPHVGRYYQAPQPRLRALLGMTEPGPPSPPSAPTPSEVASLPSLVDV